MLVALIATLVLASVVALTAIAYRSGWRWTGLPADPGDGTAGNPPRPAKTLWDWMQLLIVPLVLAMAAFALNAAQVDRDRKQQDRRAAQDRLSAERSAAHDRAIAKDHDRESALAAYLQQMSDLMTRTGRATADTQTLAQTETLVVLRRLDGVRKGLVVQFLIEADLMDRGGAGESRPLPDAPHRVKSCGGPRQPSCRRSGLSVSMSGADLREAVMPSAVGGLEEAFAVSPAGRPLAPGVSFDRADLRNADFHGLTLPRVTFGSADLRGADFSDARLLWTSFFGACLSGAHFNGAEVERRADFSFSEGRGIDFSNARLARASFADATLTDVRLSGTSTTDVRWPRAWTPSGLRITDAEARRLCRDVHR